MNKDRPDISVIVPVYNAEQFLPHCLDSILRQTGPSLETIVVDDGSTDQSGAICDLYAAQDARISVMHVENGGVARARNLAMDVARGRFLAFVDADDYLEPEAFARLMHVQLETGAEMVRGYLRTISESGLPQDNPPSMFGKPRRGILYIDESESPHRICFLGSLSTSIIDREVVEQNGIRCREDMRMASDSMMTIALAEVVKKYAYIDDILYNYRKTEFSITRAYTVGKSKKLRCSLTMLQALRNSLLRQFSAAMVDSLIANIYINYVLILAVSYGADSLLNPEQDLSPKFGELVDDTLTRRLIRHYDMPSSPNRSRVLPWLVQFRLRRLLMWACKRRAAKRYAKDLAAVAAGRQYY